MTIEEIVNTYGILTYRVSAMMSLTDVTRRLYDSDADKYRRVLKKLNQRLDWEFVRPGAEIVYISKSTLDENLSNPA